MQVRAEEKRLESAKGPGWLFSHQMMDEALPAPRPLPRARARTAGARPADHLSAREAAYAVGALGRLRSGALDFASFDQRPGTAQPQSGGAEAGGAGRPSPGLGGRAAEGAPEVGAAAGGGSGHAGARRQHHHHQQQQHHHHHNQRAHPRAGAAAAPRTRRGARGAPWQPSGSRPSST